MTQSNCSLPILFREALVVAGMPAIDEWWSRLDTRSRDEALTLWRDSLEANLSLGIQVEARLAREDEIFEEDLWPDDYYEYLVNHELYWPRRPVFHICSRHPAAQHVARRGLLPADFCCPFAHENCPMTNLLRLSSDKSIRFELKLIAKSCLP